jgi:hypothetical protein
MIRPHTYADRRRLGNPAAAALAFNPVTAGISAGVGLATAAASLWMQNLQRAHDAATGTTLIVNGLEQQLKNLDAAYFSTPNRTCADQRAALDAYDQAWLWLQSPAACGNPQFGHQGNACIEDRAPGGRWPWQSYYRDPIADDSQVAGCDTGQEVILPSLATGTYQPAPLTSTGGSSSTGNPAITTLPAAQPFSIAAGIDSTTLALVAVAIAAGLVISSGGKK